MKINSEHLDTFREINRRYRGPTHVPAPDNWRRRSNDDIWDRIIGQVIVAGGSKPAEKFQKSAKIRRTVAYTRLAKMDEAKAKNRIHSALRKVGARYASSDITKCRKTAALVHNLGVLRGTKGGPKGLLRTLSQMEGPAHDRRRIEYLMKCFSFFRSKSSRDFLMEMGLVRDAIALDVRVMNVLKAVGLPVPTNGVPGNASEYDEIEVAVLADICKPLNLAGVEFDRMIYQHYDSIMSDLRPAGKVAVPNIGTALQQIEQLTRRIEALESKLCVAPKSPPWLKAGSENIRPSDGATTT